MKHQLDINNSDFSRVLSITIAGCRGGGEDKQLQMLVSPAEKYIAFHVMKNGNKIGENIPNLNTAIDSYNLL